MEHSHSSLDAPGESRLTSTGSTDKLHSPLINELRILQHTINPATKGRMEHPWQRSLSECWGCSLSPHWALAAADQTTLSPAPETASHTKRAHPQAHCNKEKIITEKIPPCTTCPRSCKSCALSIPEWLDWKGTQSSSPIGRDTFH